MYSAYKSRKHDGIGDVKEGQEIGLADWELIGTEFDTEQDAWDWLRKRGFRQGEINSWKLLPSPNQVNG